MISLNQQVQSILSLYQVHPINEEQDPKILMDEEIKKINKKLKKQNLDIKKMKEQQNVEELLETLNKIVSDIKQSRCEYLINQNNYKDNKQERDKGLDLVKQQRETRNTLEKLYETLQSKNQQMINENQEVVNEQNRLRQEQSQSFQRRVSEIQVKLENLGSTRMQQLKENQILKDKLKEVEIQFQKREMLCQMQIEKKGLESKLMENKFEMQISHIESEQSRVEEYSNQLKELQVQEDLIIQKSAIFQQNADQFQAIMLSTNAAFSTFKKNFEHINLLSSKIESQNRETQQKSEKQDISIVNMLQNYYKLKQEKVKIDQQTSKIQQLQQALCQTIAQKEELIEQMEKQLQQ